jgi:hypothetical protein
LDGWSPRNQVPLYFNTSWFYDLTYRGTTLGARGET